MATRAGSGSTNFSANERLQRAMIGHLVDLHAFGNDVVNRIARILEATDVHLFSTLASTLHSLPATEFTVQRLRNLLSAVRQQNAGAYALVAHELENELAKLAAYEVRYTGELLDRTTIRGAAVATITGEQGLIAAQTKPMQGALLRDWAESLGETRMNRIERSLAMGFDQGRSVDEMVRTLRGTRAGGYADGLLASDARQAETVVRTAIGHYAQAARESVFEVNAEVIEAVVWSATLDLRTSDICMARDGLRYTIDGEPIGHDLPWLGGPGKAHWNCRSACYPVVKDAVAMGLEAKERASMDGPVSSKVTYGDWIRQQSWERQVEVLGSQRAALMRKGEYVLADFYTNKGRLLSLDELRERDLATFKELGL